MELGGLHHVTAVTATASANVAFYTQVLGMRLVKKTVNQDDVSAYHFFYADEHGSAGTDLTFFDWEFAGQHHPAGGMVAATALRVPGRVAVERWRER
ncbi:MAG TPA: VOC family protein, partial [Thermomicrobiales bacterium]|nr:VOC family protein [Thermomicrobiales bacterium]